MLEDGRCSLCEIPEHQSTGVPVAPVLATPSTTRRHARHVHQAAERQPHSQLPDIGEIRLHASHMRHSSSPEAAPVSDHHRPHTLSQFTNLNHISRHAINEEPIYSSRSRHAVNEEPTFIQELSSYMKKSQHGYDGGSSRNINNNDLNYTQNPNALSDDHFYKINNLPRVQSSRSKSNSYNNHVLNPKGLYNPNSGLHEDGKSNTLPTNMLSQRRESSSMHDVDKDYFLNLQRSRFSIDGLKKRETKKQRVTVQSVLLIGCFSLLFVVGIIMFVAVCYQNGWLGLGQEDPPVDNFSRRQNGLNHRYDRIGNFPDNVHRQRGTGSVRRQNEYPRIGLSGGRRSRPNIYEDRDYQQSNIYEDRDYQQSPVRFTRRVGNPAADNHHVNNPTVSQHLPRFERVVDDRTAENHFVNHPIDDSPKPARINDNLQMSTNTESFLHEGARTEENLQSPFRNEGSEILFDQLSLAFKDNKKTDFDDIGHNLNSKRNIPQERVVINVPHHSIELFPNENLENNPVSNVKGKKNNMFGLGRDEEIIPLNESNKSLISDIDIGHESSSTSNFSEGSKIVSLQSQENSSTLSNSERIKTVPIESLSRLLKDETSRSKILSVVAGVLVSSDNT